MRKNLGAKNCEFSPQHIEQITQAYLDFVDTDKAPLTPISEDEKENKAPLAPQTWGGQEDKLPENTPNVGDHGGKEFRAQDTPKLRAKIFDNADFGYYKVTIERPLRLAVQMTLERIATLRFVPAMQEIMEWAYQKWGDDIYSNLAEYKKTINEYIEKEEISITPKNKKALLDSKTWKQQKELLAAGEQLSQIIGDKLFLDFNEFSSVLNDAIKQLGVKLSSSEKNQIVNAVSWREEKAEKVIKKVHKLKGEKLEQLLEHLETTEEHLPDFGYWKSGRKSEWLEYESDSEIRDTENVPLKEKIHDYFLREVRPHVEDAWINWDKTNIGYEISFNKYFYQHQPLRSLEEVTAEILQLEQETDGLLKKLVSFDNWS